MSQVEAIYRKGVFEPLEPVNLPDNQRVRLQFDSTQTTSAQQWLDDIKRLHAKMIAEHGVLPDSAPEIAKDRTR